MLRSVQTVPTPLGNYIRPTRRDHKVLLSLIGEERLPTSGIVLDPTLWGVHEELALEAARNEIEVILDSQALELAAGAAYERPGVSSLPWAGLGPHTPLDLRGDGGARFIDLLLDFAEDKPITGFLAPTHYLPESESPWFEVDIGLVRRMREGLNRRGRSSAPLYYPLVVHADALRNPEARRRLVERLRQLDVDALWLKVHPFGATSGPLALRRYIEACRDSIRSVFRSSVTGLGLQGWPLLLSERLEVSRVV